MTSTGHVTKQELARELERAYRCIYGFHNMAMKGQIPDGTMLTYQSPVIAAARRFVLKGDLDGAAYFDGKPVEVLRDALKLASANG